MLILYFDDCVFDNSIDVNGIRWKSLYQDDVKIKIK